MKSWLFLAIPVLLLAGHATAEQDAAGAQDSQTGSTLQTLEEEVFEGWEADTPPDEEAFPREREVDEESWVDSSHSYATDKAQALTQWMDDYFGNPTYELEAAESFLRLDFDTDWDQDDRLNNRVRLRGKLQLPKISRRVNLVFSDESGDEFINTRDEPKLDDSVGLVYEVAEDERSRFDLTMGINWNRVRPGVRYRFQDTLGELYSYRLTQRAQWENDEGFYATSQAELNRTMGENTFLRWVNRAVYGEETRGTEWVSRLSLFERRPNSSRKFKLGINYFAAVNGFTDPDYVKNYRLGVLFRRQVYRKFLFLELEPAYNYRKEDETDKRHFAWSIGLTLQIALERDLARKKDPERHQDPADDNISTGPSGRGEDTVSLRQSRPGDPAPGFDLPL